MSKPALPEVAVHPEDLFPAAGLRTRVLDEFQVEVDKMEQVWQVQ